MKKFTKLFAVLALTFIALFALTACGGNPIVGTWRVESATVQTGTAEPVDQTQAYSRDVYTFKDDCTWTFRSGTGGTQGTWSFEDNVLTIASDTGSSTTTFTYKDGKLIKEYTYSDTKVTTVWVKD